MYVYSIEKRPLSICFALNTDLSSFTLDRLQFSPFFNGLRQIDLTQRHLHLADLIVLGKSVEIEDGKHQRFIHCVCVRNPLRAQQNHVVTLDH